MLRRCRRCSSWTWWLFDLIGIDDSFCESMTWGVSSSITVVGNPENNPSENRISFENVDRQDATDVVRDPENDPSETIGTDVTVSYQFATAWSFSSQGIDSLMYERYGGSTSLDNYCAPPWVCNDYIEYKTSRIQFSYSIVYVPTVILECRNSNINKSRIIQLIITNHNIISFLFILS